MQTYTNEEISELKSHKYYMVSQGKVLHVMKKSWILKNKKKGTNEHDRDSCHRQWTIGFHMGRGRRDGEK